MGIMRCFLPDLVVCLAVLSCHTAASPLESMLNRMQRNAPCSVSVEYRHQDLCCRYCPAGTYVKSPCSRSGDMGQCEECDSGTFTAHDNSLDKCLPCTQCRSSDEELVKQCTHDEDAKCQCKAGRFCHPDEACEVCKKCARCKEGEEAVRNCTATTNTECKKVQSKPGTASDLTAVLAVCVPLLLIAGGLIAAFSFYKWRRRRSEPPTDPPESVKTELQSNFLPAAGGEAETRRPSGNNLSLPRQLVRVKWPSAGEEESRRLCDSLSSSASNSQHSLTDRRDEEFPALVPVKGEESLRACFEYFEELSMDYYRRFFRSLGLSDNVIKSCDQQQYEDRVHELLNAWVEKEGRHASLNALLKALLDLSQRLTAENIKKRALQAGHYRCDELC